MTCPSKILLVAMHESNDVASVYEYVLCDGRYVVTYHHDGVTQDCDMDHCRRDFSLSKERQELYAEAYDAFSRMAEDEDCHIGVKYDSYKVIAVAFLEKSPQNLHYFDLGNDFDTHLSPLCEDAPRIKSDDAFALIAHFIPKPLWLYGMNFAARSNDLNEKAIELLQAKKLEPPTLEKTTLGTYPQSKVSDPSLIKELDERFGDIKQWQGFGYHANDYEGDYMFYRDVEWEGEKYRGVLIKEFRPDSYGENVARNFRSVQEYCGFKRDVIYWFRFDPIEWYVFEEGDTRTLISVKVLDAEAMAADIRNGQFDYDADSIMPLWLREKFVALALPSSKVDSAIIPSAKDYLRYLPKKSMRKPIATDYALAKGFLDRESEKWIDPFVWTSTYMGMTNRMVAITLDGTILDFMEENHGFITYVFGGIQPMIKIQK